MPATPLMSVDLPAPLSPTSAVTSPRYASKSTSCRTCTAPKLLFTARSDRIGCSSPTGGAVAVALGIVMLPLLPRGGLPSWRDYPTWNGGPVRAGPGPRRGSGDGCGLAGRGVLRGADVRGLLEAVVADVLDVVLEDRHRGLQRGRDVLLQHGVLDRAVDDAGRVLVLDQGDGQRGGGVRLLLDGLVDGHALLAGEDRLQAGHRRVLAGHRHLAGEVVALEPGDDAARHRVVRGDDAVDLAAVLRVDLLEGGAGHGGVPLAGLVTDQLVLAGVDRRLQRLLVALLEQRRVVVGRVAVDEDDVGAGLACVGQALLQALAHQLADRYVVERDVVRRAAAQGEAVVVDRLDAGLLRLLEARGAGVAVQVHDHQHVDAAVDHAVADGAELGLVTIRVLDVGLQARLVERRLEQRAVVGLPARRGRGVRKDHADLPARAAAPAAARAAARAVVVAPTGGKQECGRGERRRGHRVTLAHGSGSFPGSWSACTRKQGPGPGAWSHRPRGRLGAHRHRACL